MLSAADFCTTPIQFVIENVFHGVFGLILLSFAVAMTLFCAFVMEKFARQMAVAGSSKDKWFFRSIAIGLAALAVMLLATMVGACWCFFQLYGQYC
ncbi:MAG: hypothetical protein WCT10_05790 [Patescibacteria group bacterium]|jgi:uncharacterized membrane-anchored protein